MFVLFLQFNSDANAQGACGGGGKPCPRIIVNQPRPGGRQIVRRPLPPKPVSPGKPAPPNEPLGPPSTPACEDSDLVVVCGMPGCEIKLEGKQSNRGKLAPLAQTVTNDLGGYTFQVLGNYFYKAKVTKPGYEPFESKMIKVGCDDPEEIKAALTAKPVLLRVRTQPAECDIYLDGQKQATGSDSNGLFSYLLAKPTLLIEARHKGYLSDSKNIFLAPELAAREITLTLEPISAMVQLAVNVQNARVTIDDQKTAKPIDDRILLSPGQHTLTVEALGYAPAKLELSVAADESISKQVTLERLPPASLQAQAIKLFAARAYDDVLKLSRYLFDADRTNSTAHRLSGLVSLERGDLANAAAHLEKALAGGESVELRIRRHPGEKFESNKGHDSCDAQLILGKAELEFRSARNPTENFKVTYDQIQVTGIQLKNRLAAYLGTKVNVAGKKRDYNFYSFDRELSQLGKPYLEMLQGLIRSH